MHLVDSSTRIGLVDEQTFDKRLADVMSVVGASGVVLLLQRLAAVQTESWYERSHHNALKL